MTYRTPPKGWFPLGHHVDIPGPLEFSEETDEALMPLWERPRKKRFRYHWTRVLYTADYLNQWGERATPSAMRFIWSYAGRDYDAALESAFEAGDTKREKYYK